MPLSPNPPYLKAISRLDPETRRIIVSLLSHPAVSRLKSIQQLGFTSRVFPTATHSRWEHTLWTLDRLCGLLEASPPLPTEVKQHLLAACVLQDIGHSPMSNSLGPAFSQHLNDERLSVLVPHDKVRTILILEHLERTEQLFTHLGLTVEVLVQLLLGRFPWPQPAWAYRLMEGVLDADRLAYVEQDALLTLGRKVRTGLRAVMQSLQTDGPDNVTIISSEGVDPVRQFVSTRAELTLDVYHHVQKLAWEYVVRELLDWIWARPRALPDVLPPAPTTVPEFLEWNDATVERLLKQATLPEDSPAREALQLLRRGEMLVAEVKAYEGERFLSFVDIDATLATVDCPTFPAAPIWIIAAKRIPTVSIYDAGSIVVKHKGRHEPLNALSSSVPSPVTKVWHRPVVVFGATYTALVTQRFYDRKLILSDLQPLRQI